MVSGFLLVIDDSDRFVPVIEMTYAKMRLEVVGVKSVKAAKRVLLEKHPEAIICGLRLKDDPKGGSKFCAELKSHPELSKIPVMLIANELNDGLIREASEHGAKGLIAWPASVQVIRKRLEQFIPDYLAKELTPEEQRERYAKLPNIAQDELRIEKIPQASEEKSSNIEEEKLNLAKRIMAQVLHNLRVDGNLGQSSLQDVPRVVSEMTSRVCKSS